MAFVEERNVDVAEKVGATSRATVVRQCGAQRETVDVVDFTRQELDALELVGDEQRILLQQRCDERLLTVVAESERLRLHATLSPFHMAVGGAEVNGENQFLRAWSVGFPQRHNHALESAQLIAHRSLDVVEIALHIVVGGGVTQSGARLLGHLRHFAAASVGEEAQTAAAVHHIGEQLHLVGIGTACAHEWENAGAELHAADDAAHTHLLAKLP